MLPDAFTRTSHAADAVVALAAARAGADAVAATPRGAVSRKADGTEVTAADLAADAAIRAAIADMSPRDLVLSEERPPDAATASARRLWVVDPLDGTREYARGLDEYVVHVALVVDGTPLVGAVVRPGPREAWIAVAGGGAWHAAGSDRFAPVRASAVTDPAAARIAYTRTPMRGSSLAVFEALPGAERTMLGASLKWMRVAEGRADLVLSRPGILSLWDTAAPEVIVREAGGVVCNIDGAPLVYAPGSALVHGRGALVTNGPLSAPTLAWMRSRPDLFSGWS